MMADEEDLGSDSSDDDYVPSDAEGLSEEENSGEEEDLEALTREAGDDVVVAGVRASKGKKKKSSASPRKRKGGIRLEGEDASTSGAPAETDEYSKQLAEAMKKEKEEKKVEEEKKRADDLWSSFMSDVGTRPKPKPAPAAGTGLGSLTRVIKTTSSTSNKPTPTAAPKTAAVTPSSGAAASNKVTITKEYDFAGEVVRVTKEVDANSKEAMTELKKQTEPDAAKKPAIPGIKRPGGGLGSVLGMINKKQKISTLEKSKLDWNNFKKKEGIEEELSTHNKGKDGYLERQAFLSRVDMQQFELEKNIRLSNSSKR